MSILEGQNARPPRKKAKKGYAGLRQEQPKGTLTMEQIMGCTSLGHAIGTVLENGDMISFTMTSDGGCLCICILSDGDKLKSYARTGEELQDLLESLTV